MYGTHEIKVSADKDRITLEVEYPPGSDLPAELEYNTATREWIKRPGKYETEKTLLDTTLEIEGELHEVSLVWKRFQSRTVFLNGRETRNRVVAMEMFVHKLGEESESPRRVWAHWAPEFREGIGVQVCDVTVWQGHSPTTVLLVLTNTHYYRRTLFAIDPNATVPGIPREFLEVETGRWEPERPKQAQAFLEVPMELENISYGNREIKVTAADQTISVYAKHARRASPDTIVEYNTTTHEWTKR